jgi:OFA family oxalate/formate antiporter-like MFS transporter
LALANTSTQSHVNRWAQLIAAIIAMLAISNLQYAWTLFTGPLRTSLNASLPEVQIAFSTFILAETWLVPFEGALIDWLGPRLMLMAGGVLVGAGWIATSQVTTLTGLIIAYTIGGIGAGAVYGGAVGNALKWFPERRGLCVGLTSGAYGIGTALTVLPISHMIKTSGFRHTMLVWGIIQGLVVIATASVLSKPPEKWIPEGWKPRAVGEEARAKSKVHMTAVDLSPRQMIRTGSFYVIYLMMALVAFGGLVVTAQVAPIAKHYNVANVTVLFGITALVLAIQLGRITNGLTRPFFGWVSDHIGRENTMFIAFAAEALAVFGLLQTIHRPVHFIVLTGLVFFAWGEIFSLFPSIVGDLYGRKWATTNYGITYTSKGVASIFAGPVAALASVATGRWVEVFWAMILCDVVAALLALFWLKPLARRTLARNEEMVSARTALPETRAA